MSAKIISVSTPKTGAGVFPTFTRDSTAYLQDGSEVASGVPRFEHPFGKNLIVNGDFSNGLSGWVSTGSSTLKVTQNELTLISRNDLRSGALYKPCPYATHKYYLFFKGISHDSKCTLIQGNLRGDTSRGVVEHAAIQNPVPGEEYLVSGILSPTGGSGTLTLYLEAGYPANNPNLEVSYKDVILIDLTTQFGAGNEPTLAQCDEMYKDYYQGKMCFIEEGTTNLIPAYRQKFANLEASSNAVITKTQNVAMPEWNTTEATRIQSFGGTSIIKTAFSVVIPDGSVSQTLYVKNMGAYPFTSLLTSPFLLKKVQPGESMQIRLSGNKSSTSIPVWRFNSDDASHDIDIIAYQPKVEQKAYPTSWTPSTRNDEVLIVPSLSAKTISVDVGFVLDSNDYATRESKTILALGNYQIVTWESNGAVKLYDGTSYYNIITAIVKNSKVRIGLVEENGEIKVYWNGELKLTIEGTLPNSDIYLGTNTSGERHVNAYFGDLHLASKPLQVTSMSPLPIDQFTLYSALNQGNLEASQGYYENFWCLPVKYDGTTTIHIRKDDDDNV